MYYTSLIYFVPRKPELCYSSGPFTGPQQKPNTYGIWIKRWWKVVGDIILQKVSTQFDYIMFVGMRNSNYKVANALRFFLGSNSKGLVKIWEIWIHSWKLFSALEFGHKWYLVKSIFIVKCPTKNKIAIRKCCQIRTKKSRRYIGR